MELSLYTDSVPKLSFEGALDLAAEVGATGIEIAAGGQSSAPHMRIDELLEDDAKLAAFRDAFDSRGLRIAALNCSSWALHPVRGGQQASVIRRTMELARRLGVRKIVTMSGCPGDGVGATTINWIWYPWPEDAVALRERQWDQAVPFWRQMAKLAASCGIERIAFELHPLHLVYNVPTLFRMREEIGPILGVNLDPSHMFWQQMDPLAATRALADAVYHVHLKDTQLIPDQVALAGVLDQRPFEDPANRAWTFRTIGVGHDRSFWSAFVDGLRAVGYDDVLSIENEDPYQAHEEGVREAANFILPLLSETASANPSAVGHTGGIR